MCNEGEVIIQFGQAGIASCRQFCAGAAGMAGLSLRARFVNTGSPGPYLVKTSFPLSRDDLESYLRALDKPALKSFLQRSKI